MDVGKIFGLGGLILAKVWAKNFQSETNIFIKRSKKNFA